MPRLLMTPPPYSVGSGRYEWIDLAGKLQTAAHWDDLPDAMQRIVAFVPDAPPEPHDDQAHAHMEQFPVRFRQAMGRCRDR